MNVNFGLFPPLAKSPSRRVGGERLRGAAKAMLKRRALTQRALIDLDLWVSGTAVAAASQVAPLVPASEGSPVPEPHPP